jgi:hypothetical protein
MHKFLATLPLAICALPRQCITLCDPSKFKLEERDLRRVMRCNLP